MQASDKDLKSESKKLPMIQRRATSVSPVSLVEISYPQPGASLPLVIQPAVDGVGLVPWAINNRAFINAELLKHGGMLFRNFGLREIAEFEAFISAVSGQLLEYRERSSPRSQVQGNIYTSTDYPADQSIFLHNENSYQASWPLRIFFCCISPAQEGGETPIADVRKVLQHIDPAINQRFARQGWMYVRNFIEGIGLSWQTVFQTSDRDAVEAYCREAEIETEWRDGGRLRTRAIRQAIWRHPQTDQLVWFNHATFFHISTLAPTIREQLLAAFTEEDLPSNTYYGDGSPIEPEVLDHLRDAYHQETVVFPWQQGDILMLDNMLVAHGRAPFVGPREIVVGMSEPLQSKDLD